VLGGIGMIVPWATGILPVLTPVAAICLAVLMGGAVKTHVDLKEPFAPAAVLGVLCVFVVVGRFALVPFGG
jgi:DoxX-like family